MSDTRESTQNRLNVAVLTCGTLGQEVAAALQNLEMVGRVVLFTTPYRTLKLGALKSAMYTVRMDGWTALFRAVGRRISRTKNVCEVERPVLTTDVSVEHHHFADFHDPDCLEAISAFSPDLGVVAGTYILREQVFSIPRLGCVNLHSGKAPKYRGSMPAFWELFNGETEVGITIHRVISQLDAGEVLRQETFPLDPAPPGDVFKYLDRYRREVLRPNGVRMLVETVRSIGDGTITGWQQDERAARAYRLPTHREKMELCRRVVARRGGQA
jgi:methionyl-tRNA formyltransferase